MSGGVDSSVAAALLAREGHEVIGLSMQLYDHSGSHADGEVRFGSCCTIDDLHDARRVASQLGIPHYIVNFERQFDETVVSNFVREYANGRTPIPCVHCNGDLKFATLAARAEGLGAGLVATGHYARVEAVNGDVPAQARRRSCEGSVVFSFHADAGSAVARDVPCRRARQDRRPCARARARPRRLGEAGQPRDLLRGRRRPQRLSRVARRRPFTRRHPRHVRPRRRHARRRAPLHGRPAKGPRTVVGRSPLRRGHRRQCRSGDRRSAGGAGACDADRVGRELDRRNAAAGRRTRYRADPSSASRGRGDRPSAGRAIVCQWSSTSRSTRSRQDRRSFSTTGTTCWVGAGSIDICDFRL